MPSDPADHPPHEPPAPPPAAAGRTELILSVLAGRRTVRQAARAAAVPEGVLAWWVEHFVHSGAAGLRGRGAGDPPYTAPDQLTAENERLRVQLYETYAELDLWRTVAGGALGPSATLR
jgi:hypothetical protein